MIDFKINKQASIHINSHCIAINTRSGFGMVIQDPEGEEFILARDASCEVIGDALIKALNATRLIIPEMREEFDIPDYVIIDYDFYDFKKSDERYKSWMERLKTFTGMKTINKLFKPMFSIAAEVKNEVLFLEPTHQVKINAYDGIDNVEDIQIAVDVNSSNEQIGKAVLEASLLCTSKFS